MNKNTTAKQKFLKYRKTKQNRFLSMKSGLPIQIQQVLGLHPRSVPTVQRTRFSL